MRKIIVRILKRLHLYNLAVKIFCILQKVQWKVSEYRNKKKIKSTSDEAGKLIKAIEEDIGRKIVYIFQQTYYTTDGKTYISGGGERYASDLAELIFEGGYQPILVQFGEPKSDRIWQVKRGELIVLGLNVEWRLYTETISLLPKPSFSIYSGFTDFGKNFFSPNIMISHGVTWDAPGRDVSVEYIKNILLNVDGLVSVDTNTISWLRSTFSKTLAEKPVHMHYVPNYADVVKYKPDMTLKDDDHIRVIFPRRCSPERGFWLITEVLPQILDKYEKVIFDYVGFIHTDDIGRVIEELKVRYPSRVRHYFVDADEMYKTYQMADICLIPTLYCEGTSLSCIEAMACGNVVIATNVGGLPNLIIDKYNGRLINPEAKELLKTLDEVIGDKMAMHTMSENAVAVAQTFSKNNWEERWKKILSESMKGNNR